MWAPLISVGIGIWLILSPALFHFDQTDAAAAARIIGPVIVAASTLALWEVLAAARWISVAASFSLLTSPLWLPNESPSALVTNVIAGLFVLGLGLLSRRRKRRYGGGWSALRRSPPTDFDRFNWS